MNAKKLREASEHLFYEIDMLNISAVKVNNADRKKTLAKLKSDKEKVWDAQVELNLALDSFAIHARNLIEFFKGKKNKGQKYMRAEQYLDKVNLEEFRKIMSENPKLVNYIFDKSNHQVAHLTFERTEPRFKGENKGWDLKMIEEFNSIIKSFLNLTSDEILCVRLNEWKRLENPFQEYIRRYIEG